MPTQMGIAAARTALLRFTAISEDWTAKIEPGDYRRLVESGLGPGDIQARAEHLHKADEKRYAEAGSFYGGFDFNNEGNAGPSPMGALDQQFVPISGGPYNRQLYLFAHWDQVAKSFEMRHHSELAKATIDILSDFCLGRGVTWKIKHQRFEAVWREFWEDGEVVHANLLFNSWDWIGW